jgi:hypothetical protein
MHTHVFRPIAAVVISLMVFAPSTSAQIISDDFGAYRALVGTPMGALPPVMTSTILGSLQRTTQFAIRYGYLSGLPIPGSYQSDKNGANNVAASVVLPMSIGSTLTGTAGIWYPTKADANGDRSASLLLGAGGDYRLGSAPVGDSPDAPVLMIGLNGDLGYGKPREGTVWSAAVGTPVGLVTRGTGMQIATFLIPAIGFGNFDASSAFGGQSFSGMRYSVGGGVGLFNPASTMTVNLGFQHVFISGSSTVVGVVVSLGSS